MARTPPSARKTQHTGNPVRPAVIAAAQTPYPGMADGTLRMLVTGGSQGARVMADVVPAAHRGAAAGSARARRSSCSRRAARTRRACARPMRGLASRPTSQPFFTDLPQRIADAHLVISRAGASTVCELAVIGRPAILVPYPFALDHDQAANAARACRERRRDGHPRRPISRPTALHAEIEGAFADPRGLDAARRGGQERRRAGCGRAARRSRHGDGRSSAEEPFP